MSLLGTLSLGRNALAAQQAALQVTSNNISNAGNTDYTRQVGVLSPSGDSLDASGFFLGSGVNLSGVNRQIDNALLQRIHSATSDNASASANQNATSQVESVFNALGTNGLSSKLSAFFNSWSKLASNPQDSGQRQIVLTNGTTVANTFQDLRRQLGGIRTDLNSQISAQVGSADDLSRQIAILNGQITVAEGGSPNGAAQANALRDQRDTAVRKLSELLDVSTTEDRGSLNVFVGSQPLVIGTVSRGVASTQINGPGGVQTQLVFKDDGKTAIPITSGKIGGLVSAISTTDDTTSQLDTLASGLIVELNQIHASGQGLAGLTNVTSTNAVTDPAQRLDKAGLASTPQNGSFVVTVTSKTTGLTTSKLIKVDLSPGSASPTTLASLASQLSDTNIQASTLGGRLAVKAANPDVTITFSQDSSNTLAALGVNTFFSGSNASDISVNATLQANPQLIAAARNGSPGDNQTALAIASLDTKSLVALGGKTLRQTYDTTVTTIAAKTAAAKTSADGTTNVLQTLTAQREALSGVSLDEESINLIAQQRAFQGAARVISTVDDMIQTVLGLVR